MKKLILIAMIIGLSPAVFGQALDKLEQAYFTKAEKLINEHRVRTKISDDILAKNSKRLAEAYISALKAMLIAETKKGDFDKAVKIKVKITEMENLLKIGVVGNHHTKDVDSGLSSKPFQAKVDFIVGSWIWHHKGQVCKFAKDGTYIGRISTGTWVKASNKSYTMTNSKNKIKQTMKVIDENTMLNTTHNFKVYRITH